MNILFFDPVAKRPYTMHTIRTYATGASEASLMRIAAGLADIGHNVDVFQVVDQSRREVVIDKVRHVNSSSGLNPDVIVHQRTAKFVEDLSISYPQSKHIIWMHDLCGPWFNDEPFGNTPIVCVSQYAKNQLIGATNRLDAAPRPHVIYNPVVVDGERKQKHLNRLGFFSSPQKGLLEVIERFRECLNINPELKLVIANPGYIALPRIIPEYNIEVLGELSHRRVLEEMSKCQVIFYPQTTVPETMGVVLAEANAIGVPVLAHNFGAASEILEGGSNFGKNLVIDCTIPNNVSISLQAALTGFMKPDIDSRFELNRIVKNWDDLLRRIYVEEASISVTFENPKQNVDPQLSSFHRGK